MELEECLTFVGVGLDSSLCLVEAEGLPGSYSESAVFGVKPHFALPHSIQNSFEFVGMVYFFSRFDDHVVYIYFESVPISPWNTVFIIRW